MNGQKKKKSERICQSTPERSLTPLDSILCKKKVLPPSAPGSPSSLLTPPVTSQSTCPQHIPHYILPDRACPFNMSAPPYAFPTPFPPPNGQRHPFAMEEISQWKTSPLPWPRSLKDTKEFDETQTISVDELTDKFSQYLNLGTRISATSGKQRHTKPLRNHTYLGHGRHSVQVAGGSDLTPIPDRSKHCPTFLDGTPQHISSSSPSSVSSLDTAPATPISSTSQFFELGKCSLSKGFRQPSLIVPGFLPYAGDHVPFGILAL